MSLPDFHVTMHSDRMAKKKEPRMEKSKARKVTTKLGRPETPDGDITIHLRSTAEERTKWRDEAKKSGMRFTTFVKMAVNSFISYQKAAQAAATSAAKASK